MGFRPIGPAPAKGTFRPIQSGKSNFRPVSSLPAAPVVERTETPVQEPKQSRSAWRFLGDQLVKPLASASNLIEDTGKTIGFGIANMIKPELEWKDANVNFLKNQKDVWIGKNKRTYSDVMAEIAGEQMAKGNNALGNVMTGTGVAADFILDPLNKVKILGLTQKGIKAAKTGEVALSAAEQAKKGQRALLQFGNTNILPSVGNRVLAASTKANNVLRDKAPVVFNALSKVSTKIRPSGVSRADFKMLADARTSARLTQNYTKDQAIQFAKGLEQSLRKKGASEEVRSQILHAIEKGDKSLVPKGLDDVFDAGVAFKASNEKAWKKLGGSTLDNYGLAHVANDRVAEEARKGAFKGQGMSLSSTKTPQDIHRDWVKIDGKIGKLSDEGIKYSDNVAKATDDPLLSEARKYKSAELDRWRKDSFWGNTITEKSSEVNVPLSEIGEGKTIGIRQPGVNEKGVLEKMSKIKNGERPAILVGNRPMGKREITVLDGNHTLSAYKRLGFKEVPVIDQKSQLTDLWNKAQEGAKKTGQFLDKKGNPVNVTQATAQEINNALVAQGKQSIFKEDLPTVVARMGISTGRKQAGVEFLEATKGLQGKAKDLANEAYEAMTNVESLRKAIKYFDNVQNVWKAQVLVAPSYHIRNEAGNLWNNFLANVAPDSYVKAGALQRKISAGTLTKAEAKAVEEMKKLGVIGTGQYGGDITQTIADEVGGASINPLSQRFGLYKGNRAVGSAVEDNAKIAHYLSKIREGYAPKQAAESVRKYLFDYSDLTWGEQNILKRVIPFYTWTRKNVPLQVQSFFETPGKFSNAATVQRSIEGQVEQPDERYLSDYIKKNSPIRISTNEDGTTSYLLLGQWLPSASALQILTQDPRELLNMLSPVYKVPKDMLDNTSFFEDSLGRKQPIERYPGEMKSFLGMDMGAKTANILRNIRVLSELDKLNPGLIFGGKDTPSKIPGGSQNRGAKQSPDAPEAARWRDFLTGKTQTYDPENAQRFYDRDTQDRMNEYEQALNQALRFENKDQAEKILQDMRAFQAERGAGKNATIDQYELMGDRFLEDAAKDNQAEYERKTVREKMRKMIREGIRTGKNDLIEEAMKMDPSYAGSAIKDALKEQSYDDMSDENKRLMYEVERMKTENRLNPFYSE